MQIFLLLIFYCVCYEVTAQKVDTVSPVSQINSNWAEFTPPPQADKESIAAKRDKFSCVLNLLKNALTEELQNSYYLTEDTAQNNVSAKNVTEEKQTLEIYEDQLERPNVKVGNETDVENAYKKMNTKITPPAFYNNNISEQNNFEMPNMIPIFKPRPQPKSEQNQNAKSAEFTFTPTRKVPTSKPIAFVPERIVQTVMRPISSQPESNQRVADFSTTPRQIQKSRAVSFVPEKIIQTNISPNPNYSMFNIPCHRAADVLDMSVVVPKEASCRKTKENSKADMAKASLQSQTPTSISCADEDNDAIAMLFKPKNITMEQVYGNLLKKTTITVLVPYHMSKLGGKQKQK